MVGKFLDHEHDATTCTKRPFTHMPTNTENMVLVIYTKAGTCSVPALAVCVCSCKALFYALSTLKSFFSSSFPPVVRSLYFNIYGKRNKCVYIYIIFERGQSSEWVEQAYVRPVTRGKFFHVLSHSFCHTQADGAFLMIITRTVELHYRCRCSAFE